MSDMNARRMAYRNAVRAATYQLEGEQLKSEAETSKNQKIYHAHGYVVRSENKDSGEGEWTHNSTFFDVFTDFEAAKQYLLAKFWEVLDCVYRTDKLRLHYPEEQCDIKKESPKRQREYIEEHIDYALVISAFSPFGESKESGLTMPDKKDWYLRHTGEIINN